MQYIKADTNTEVLIGPAVAVGDGFTPVTTLSLSTADEAEIIKYGGATPLTVTSISANGFAAITSADGYYTLDITTGNSDTEGFLTVLINDDSLILPIRVDFMVVNANVYDSLFAAATTDYLQTDPTQLGGSTQSLTDLKDFADAGYDPATNKVEGVKLVDTTTTNTDMVAAAPTAAAIVNEWETQSQADPTGFHVNVIEADSQTVSAAAGVTLNAEIGASAIAMDAFEDQYDGTGLTGDTYPATQAQIGNIASGSAAISTVAESYNLTTGTQSSGTYTDTETRNDVRHEHTDTGNAMELYYQFDVGGNGSAVEAMVHGYLTSTNDSLDVFAYDWAGTAWDQIGVLDGSGATDGDHTYNLLTRHTGTGANLGKVRIRFYAASGLSTATLAIDQITASYSVVAQSVGYDGGQVWVDTADGTAGTESYVNGVADNPVLTLADAITIASSIGLHRFYVSNESTITFAESHTNEVWSSNGGTMALGGQDISSSHFYHFNDISGTGTSGSGETHLIDSHIANSTACTLGQAHITRCSIGTGGLVLSQAANYVVEDCKSGIAGATAPTIDMGAAVGASNMSVRNWSGGLTLNNLASGDVVTLEGTFGTVTLNGADASVEIRGIAKAVTNNLTGSPTVNDNSVKSTDIEAILADTADMQPKVTTMESGIIEGAAATGTLSTTVATTDLTGYADDQLIGRVIVWTSGACEGEATRISDYANTNGQMTFTALTTAPANGDTFKLV